VLLAAAHGHIYDVTARHHRSPPAIPQISGQIEQFNAHDDRVNGVDTPWAF